MKTYRVKLARLWAVEQDYDVEAETPGAAQAKALEAVNEIRPDPIKEAVDTGWRTNDALCTGIREIGAVRGPLSITFPTTQVRPGVYRRIE